MKKALAFIALAGLVLPSILRADPDFTLKKKALLGLAGWVVFNDPGNASLADFEKNASQIDRAYFDWYTQDGEGMPITRPEVTQVLKDRAIAAARQGQCQAWGRISNLQYLWSANDASAIPVGKWIFNGDLTKKFIDTLVGMAKKDQLNGIQVDYELNPPPPSYGRRWRRAFTNFMGQLKDACHKNNLYIGVVVYGKNSFMVNWDPPRQFNYPALGKIVDEMVLTQVQGSRGHGQHDPAGFLDNPIDTEVFTKYMCQTVSPSKVEVIGHIDGFDWVGVNGTEISWADFQDLAKKNNVTPVRDERVSQELSIEYPPAHEAWFSDGKAVEYVADLVKRYKTAGICVWRFGSEGPDFWEMWKRANSSKQLTASVGLVTVRKKEVGTKIREVFTGKTRGFYFYAYGGDPNDPDSPNDSNVKAVEKNGRYWVDVSLRGDTWSGFGIGICRVNLLPYMEHGALQFYARGAKGGEQFAVGFSCAAGIAAEEHYGLGCEVPIENYCQLTPEWQKVTIPLAEFPQGGGWWDDITNESGNQPFRWNSVNEFICSIGPSADPFIQYQLSEVRIIPYYDALSVHRIKNDTYDGHQIKKPDSKP